MPMFSDYSSNTGKFIKLITVVDIFIRLDDDM